METCGFLYKSYIQLSSERSLEECLLSDHVCVDYRVRTLAMQSGFSWTLC